MKVTSKVSDVPREDLYRILQTLVDLGLVQKRITFPITFEAIPPRDALSFLHERRMNHTAELQKETKKFFEKSMANLFSRIHEEESHFVLIPKKEAVMLRRKKSINNAEHTIDIINSWKRFLISTQVYAKNADNAMNRGVKIRVIVQKPEMTDAVQKALTDLKKKPGLSIRYAPAPLSALVSIVDRKEGFILVNEEADVGKSPALWIKHPGTVTIAQSYFDMLWLASAEE